MGGVGLLCEELAAAGKDPDRQDLHRHPHPSRIEGHSMRKIALALLAFISAAPAYSQSIKKLDPALDGVIAPGTKIEKVATGFLFIEGPMWRDGKLWFSDVKGDKGRTFDPQTGKVTVILKDSGGVKDASPDFFLGSNATVTDKDRSLLLTPIATRT